MGGGFPNSWMLYVMEHPTKIRMMTRGTPIFLETSKCLVMGEQMRIVVNNSGQAMPNDFRING